MMKNRDTQNLTTKSKEMSTGRLTKRAKWRETKQLIILIMTVKKRQNWSKKYVRR
jgi:hypothetical protein